MTRRYLIAVLLAVSVVLPTHARDTEHKFPITDVFSRDDYASQLDGVSFYFAGQSHPKVVRSFGEFQSNLKTNAFNKSDNEACAWVLLSTLLSLRDRALSEGGNAVINIFSNYKKHRFESPTEYMCGAGNIMAGVTLKGEVVEIAE